MSHVIQILYIHGANSHFKPDSKKVRTLGRMGTVHGFDNDYSLPYTAVMENLLCQYEKIRPDLIVGTSLGGYLAAQLANLKGCPFIAVNPAIDPASMSPICNTPDFPPLCITYNEVHGTIFLSDDLVIDPNKTHNKFKERYQVVRFPGGDHRFDSHIDEAVDYYMQTVNFGFGPNISP